METWSEGRCRTFEADGHQCLCSTANERRRCAAGDGRLRDSLRQSQPDPYSRLFRHAWNACYGHSDGMGYLRTRSSLLQPGHTDPLCGFG
jgi:hypothetical protein